MEDEDRPWEKFEKKELWDSVKKEERNGENLVWHLERQRDESRDLEADRDDCRKQLASVVQIEKEYRRIALSVVSSTAIGHWARDEWAKVPGIPLGALAHVAEWGDEDAAKKLLERLSADVDAAMEPDPDDCCGCEQDVLGLQFELEQASKALIHWKLVARSAMKMAGMDTSKAMRLGSAVIES